MSPPTLPAAARSPPRSPPRPPLLVVRLEATGGGAAFAAPELLEEAFEHEHEDVSVFPLAIPLIAGPGAITSTLLLTTRAGGDWVATLLVLGILALVLASTLGALLIGFSFYLCGWTAHDYLHHGVIKGSSKRMVHWNNACGYALGMWQGYSVGWWRARHNTHHLVTNEDGNDPDIKTAPLLIYVRNNPAIAATLNAVQRWQQYYYVPLMSILDAYWRFESLQVPRTLTPTLTSSLTLIRAIDY